MGFTLWDTASGNALGYAESEADALALVRELIATTEPDVTADLLLMYDDPRGECHTVAAGEVLVQRALAPRAAETLEHIVQLVAAQRASNRPDLDQIEQAARAGLLDLTRAGRG